MSNVRVEQDQLTDARRRFIEDVGRYMATYGVPATTGRLIAYLLLSAEPVSLDQIAAGLEISKSSASVAARQVELFGLARRIGQRGSRRVLYEVIADPLGLMTASLNQTVQFVSLLRRGAGAAEPGAAREQIEGMLELYEVVVGEIDGLVRRLRARRRE